MAGFLRSILTIISAALKHGTASPLDSVTAWFRITPLDTGMSKSKSDKYLHLVESAQIDFFIKTKLAQLFIKNRYGFVNLSQLVKFSKPVKLFSSVQVRSRILYWDDRIVYFEHEFFIGEKKHASVLVKSKFKDGGKTVEPGRLVGPCSTQKPRYLAD